MAEEFELLIKQLPNLLQYYVPGYIFIMIYDFVLAKKRRESANLHLECIVISYIIVIITRSFFEILQITESYRIVILCEFLIASIIAYIISRFLPSEFSERILKFIGINRSLRRSIWDDYIDSDFGTLAIIYMDDKDLIYYGDVVSYDYESENSNYIAMAYYDIYNSQWELQYEAKGSTYVTLIKLDGISRIEFVYDENSRISKKNMK